MKYEKIYRRWSWKEGVFGTVGKRWISHTLWWTDEYKEFGKMIINGKSYGVPVRIQYFGKRYCWTIGASSQTWSWKRNGWTDDWRHFVVYPRDHMERWVKAGKPKTNRFIR